MTNYIEELMKAAGVDRLPKPCNECEHYMDCGSGCQTPYPVFTPAKQLELIKLIVEKCQEIKIYKNKYIDSFLFQAQESWGEYEYKADVENFDSCLAALILELLKNNELNKSEVKRILEDF